MVVNFMWLTVTFVNEAKFVLGIRIINVVLAHNTFKFYLLTLVFRHKIIYFCYFYMFGRKNK